MLGLEALGATGKALSGVGIVFAEAIILYVVYGALTATISDPLQRTLQGD